MTMVEPIDPINRAHETKPVKKIRPRSEEIRSGEGDEFKVSSFAKTLKKAVEEAKKIPEVRDDKVEILKRKIQDGTYEPDLDALARILRKAGFKG
ncbi:MAG: flagellar biosynthesis anti-sigma factor FlgM [Saccharofermentanales bacterium]